MPEGHAASDARPSASNNSSKNVNNVPEDEYGVVIVQLSGPMEKREPNVRKENSIDKDKKQLLISDV